MESFPDETTFLIPRPTSPPRKPPTLHDDRSKWLAETWFLIKASVPIILAYMLQNSLQTVSILVVGRLSPEALATAAFSYMFAMATAWLIALGGTTALDTLASSSYTRSKDKGSLGILLQRGLFVLTAFYAVVAVIWCFSGSLFRALGQKEFICVQSPRRKGYIVRAPMLFSSLPHSTHCSTTSSSTLLALVFMGRPWQQAYPTGSPSSFLVAYTAFVKGSECWSGFDPGRALTNLKPFAKLAFLGVIHVGTEWWAFEIVALAAGRLGTIPLAAQSVVMTADQIINTIPFGLGVAESTRLGNLLGLGDAVHARRSAHAAAILSMIFGALVLTVLMACRNSIGRLFNDDERVIDLVAHIMPYVALFQIADGLNGSCGGALRGMGRQWVGALVNCISYYGGALPAGIYLAFHGWGLSGLWIGQCVALFLVGILEWMIIAVSNWDAEVQKASDRLEGDGMTDNSADEGV
ncbi:hypothetical protein CEP52_004718 [Fusarium oligoseptatum]|uniref:Uncharacterized protein n=1 Tax=Fusarium oligoseptatum TaxID=2604345 RepID=A0A428U1Z7_9HYPO|nr:hypothetical protein CEP52_004718 [Fusarium oligoseptatum]